ncbi:MAG: hypothetical protein ACXWWC_05945 [Chitinophagaceae bacterium]
MNKEKIITKRRTDYGSDVQLCYVVALEVMKFGYILQHRSFPFGEGEGG